MITRLRRSLRRAFKAMQMRFARSAAGAFGRMFPRSRFDYERAVDPLRSNIVMACVNWIARTFPEAPLVVRRPGPDGQPVIVQAHPMINRIERPNAFYSGNLLWTATLADLIPTGNAYWIKRRASPRGRVTELWWIPQSLIEPRFPDDGSEFITHYEYRPGGQVVRYEPSDVVHFRWGMDPDNPRKGLSPLASVLREIFTDDEAANFTASLLRNLGVPGVVIAPDSDAVVDEDDAATIREQFMGRFGGDGRGGPMVLTSKAKVQMVSFSPEQMSLRDLRRIPEERISAVIGIPAIVVGLGAGLDRSTFANYAEAREAAYESCMIPLQRLLTAELRSQLLTDFGDPEVEAPSFDLAQVRILQDDRDKLVARIDQRVRGGWMTIAAAKRAVGEDPLPGDEVYLRQLAIMEVAPGEAGSTSKAARSREHKARAVRTSRSRMIERAARTLVRFLEEQAARTAERLVASRKTRVSDVFPEDELGRLREVLAAVHITAVARGWEDGQTDVGGDAAFDPLDIQVQRTMRQLGQRIVGIDEETRSALARYITQVQADGLAVQDIADGVRGLPAFGEARAYTIARTELATAENWGTSASYRGSGFVESVTILDGDGCGWDGHDDPDVADGSTRTLDEFEAVPVSHPNCVRAASPVVAGVPAAS